MNKNNFKLCYVRERFAYFTTRELSEQQGYGWDKSPHYEKSGPPFRSENLWEIKRIEFDTNVLFQPVSPSCSVNDINKGESPWLRSSRLSSEYFEVNAGVTIEDFISIIETAGGTVFLPVEPTSEVRRSLIKFGNKHGFSLVSADNGPGLRKCVGFIKDGWWIKYSGEGLNPPKEVPNHYHKFPYLIVLLRCRTEGEVDSDRALEQLHKWVEQIKTLSFYTEEYEGVFSPDSVDFEGVYSSSSYHAIKSVPDGYHPTIDEDAKKCAKDSRISKIIDAGHFKFIKNIRTLTELVFVGAKFQMTATVFSGGESSIKFCIEMIVNRMLDMKDGFFSPTERNSKIYFSSTGHKLGFVFFTPKLRIEDGYDGV